MLSNVKPPY